MALWKVYLCVAILGVINVTAGIKVTLSKVEKVVRGSNITFTATVTDYKDPTEQVQFIFRDNAIPHHEDTILGLVNTSCSWIVEYPKVDYEAGDYTVTVEVQEKRFDYFWVNAANDSTTFQLTDTFNGKLKLSQNNTERYNNFVAVNNEVQHYIQLPEDDMKYIEGNSSQITTYWYIDCTLVSTTDGFSYNHTYTDNMGTHHVEAILSVNNKPLVPITTTTTTDKPTTIQPNTTTVKTKPNLPLSVINLSNATLNRTKRSADETDNFRCNNTIATGDGYTYGRYESTLNVREPISAVNITGLNWLQHGDLLNLTVKYSGSPPFSYCYLYKFGQYNITGNETCEDKTTTITNRFRIVHYFSDSDQHTVVVVVENGIGKKVSMATIIIYKQTVHPQLSVIVIPVCSCLVAVILVVFGIAYYQHRSRHTVEVADFDFGAAHPDYKTFRERLRDSFRNAFNFGTSDDTDPLTTNSRYESMS